jgi:hypothetical protein
MDVHPPHAGIHSWKDFWIHLGTITIGLLIAIGLEQSVEWMHHLHQRHVLEADLREEARKNLILMDIDYKYFDAMRPWLDATRKNVNDARASGGKIKAVYQTPPVDIRNTYWPDAPFWKTAKESAEISLLPRDEAGMFDLVYTQQDLMKTTALTYDDKVTALAGFENRFAAVASERPVPDLSRMTPDELGQYSELLTDLENEMLRFRQLTDRADGITLAAKNGAQSDEELLRMIGARPTESAKADAAH